MILWGRNSERGQGRVVTAELVTVRGAHSLGGLVPSRCLCWPHNRQVPGRRGAGRTVVRIGHQFVQPGLETAVAVGML